MRGRLRRIGNSRGIILPKSLISQLDLGPEIELDLEDDAIVIRRVSQKARQGWADASALLAKNGEVKAAWPAFGNRGDKKLRW